MKSKGGTKMYDFNISKVESNVSQKGNNYDTYKVSYVFKTDFLNISFL